MSHPGVRSGSTSCAVHQNPCIADTSCIGVSLMTPTCICRSSLRHHTFARTRSKICLSLPGLLRATQCWSSSPSWPLSCQWCSQSATLSAPTTPSTTPWQCMMLMVPALGATGSHTFLTDQGELTLDIQMLGTRVIRSLVCSGQTAHCMPCKEQKALCIHYTEVPLPHGEDRMVSKCFAM